MRLPVGCASRMHYAQDVFVPVAGIVIAAVVDVAAVVVETIAVAADIAAGTVAKTAYLTAQYRHPFRSTECLEELIVYYLHSI